MSKKDMAIKFLELASAGDVEEAYKTFVHPDFAHHNPYFKGDRESLQNGMRDSAREMPDKTFTPLRALEDGNLVAVHGKVQLRPGSPEIALIHIFRFKDDKIIEEWEAAQEAPKESSNENGMF